MSTSFTPLYYINLEENLEENIAQLLQRKAEQYYGRIIQYLKNAKWALKKSEYYAYATVLDHAIVQKILSEKNQQMNEQIQQILQEGKTRLNTIQEKKKKHELLTDEEKSLNKKGLFIHEQEKIKSLNARIARYQKAMQDNDSYWLQLEEPEEKTWTSDIQMQFYKKNNSSLYIKHKPKNFYLTIIFDLQSEDLIQIKPNSDTVSELKTIFNQKSSNIKLYLKANTVNIDRQINALETLIYKPQAHHRALIKLIERENISWDPLPNNTVSIPKYYVLTDENRSGTEEQRNFVKKAMATPDFAILEGPPGSGKTTAILELIIQLAKKGERILLTASTHVAIDNVLEKLKGVTNVHSIVFPLRVGKVEEKISESVSEYTLENTKTRVFTKIKQDLESIPKELRLPSQNEFLSLIDYSLHNKNSNSDSDNNDNTDLFSLILEGANLFCGTTIGFIAHLEVIQSLIGAQTGPIFDTMIIDEASKTPFSEFLVPALYAKRWIIIGDRFQLSPYLDDTFVASYILDRYKFFFSNKWNEKFYDQKLTEESFISIQNYATLFLPPPRKAISHEALVAIYDPKNQKIEHSKEWALFLAIQVALNNGTVLILSSDLKQELLSLYDELFFLNSKDQTSSEKQKKNNENLQEQYEQNFSLLEENILAYEPYASEFDKLLYIYASNLIVGTQNEIQSILQDLPPDFSFTITPNVKNTLLSSFLSRKKAWLTKNDPKNAEKRIKRLVIQPKDWANEIAWRLNRRFQLREDKNNKRYNEYEKEIKFLLPKFFNIGDHNGFQNQLEWINAFVLPSIIELLQTGAQTKRLKGTLFYKGFTNHSTLRDRIEILKYQHRMHPDISEFPRNAFYNDEKLKDGNDMKFNREWEYTRGPHVVWYDVHGEENTRPTSNEKEAKYILRDLQDFIAHCDRISNLTNEPLTIGIITFYRGQERLLKQIISNKLIGRESRWFTFTTEKTKKRLIVEICTVDRFQGKEADVIFLSMVKTKGLGFIDSPNRLNVALTRAKYALKIYGRVKNFEKQSRSPLLQNLIKHLNEKGWISKPLT